MVSSVVVRFEAGVDLEKGIGVGAEGVRCFGWGAVAARNRTLDGGKRGTKGWGVKRKIRSKHEVFDAEAFY